MPSPEVPDVEIDIPPRPEFVGVVRHVMAALGRVGNLSPEVVEDVKLAVSEACTNAVTVTARAGAPGPVTVSGTLEGERIHVVVQDRGVGGDPEWSRVASDVPDSLDFSFERGLSLPLIEGLVDSLEIGPREGGGNVVRMVLSGREAEPD
jgi:serine/threonine-protein kinase RsbW